MAFADFAPADRPTTRVVARALKAAATAFFAWRAARARRIALSALMEMEPHRLDDLGISINDVVDALGR